MKAAHLLLALACLATVDAKENEKEKNAPERIDDKLVVLDPFQVKVDPISSFAFDIRIYSNPDSRKVDRMFVTGVLEYSDAEKAGLRTGDEIIKIDGMAVKGMEARLGPDSQLGALLLNRQAGEPMNLEIITRRTQKMTLHAHRPAGVPARP